MINSVVEDFKIAHNIKVSGPIPMEGRNSSKWAKVIESQRTKAINRDSVKKKTEHLSQDENQKDSIDSMNLKPQDVSEKLPDTPPQDVIPEPAIVPPEPLPNIVNKILERHWFPLEKVNLIILIKRYF